MADRRAVLAGSAVLAAFPAFAKKPAPPPRTANIHWPGVNGELHGYMAISAGAKGPQPAVLVIHDTNGSDAFLRTLTDRLATAGFVACAPTRLTSLDEATASVRWLATNRYATGRVAAIGLGWGGELVQRIAATPGTMLAAAITFGASPLPNPGIPFLQFDAIGQVAAAGENAYDAAWQQTIAFLKEHLA